MYDAEEECADDGGCHEGHSVSLLQEGSEQPHATETAEQSEGGGTDDLGCQRGTFLQALTDPCGQPQAVDTEHGGLGNGGEGQGDEEARVVEEAHHFAHLPCEVL